MILFILVFEILFLNKICILMKLDIFMSINVRVFRLIFEFILCVLIVV